MIMEWLEPSIDEQADMLFDQIVREDPEDLHQRFLMTIEIPGRIGGNCEKSFELENLLLLRTKQAIKFAYSRGILDGLNINK